MTDGNLAGRYRLLATLGHGGMADVHLAAAQGPAGFSKLLVVKELRAALAQDPDFLDMFLDEARLAARLDHPNIVQTYEALASEGRYFIAMEYLDGQPLNRILAELAKRQDPALILGLRVICEALAGLHYAHELRDHSGRLLEVVHRDVTPHNVLVTYDGQVKLVDFGIAKTLGSATETRVGMLKGKVGYMAPEQARGDAIDRRTDVYGMGVVLWELLARRRMWRGTPDVVILNRLSLGDVPTLASVAPTVPAELQRICARATAAEPNERFANADDLRCELERYVRASNVSSDQRSVGALVTNLFAVERERMRTVIQVQLDSTRVPAVLEQTSTSRSGSLDPRFERISVISMTPSPTPAELVFDIPAPSKQDVDTTVLPRGTLQSSRLGALLGAALLLCALALLSLLALADRPGQARLELSGAITSDTSFTRDHEYVLRQTTYVAPGVTVTIEPGTRLVADPVAGAMLVIAPGARVVSGP